MGLLGENWEDPKSQAVMALAGGLLQGNFGKGVTDFGTVMGESKKKQLDLQKEQMSMDMLKQQIAQATRTNQLINDWMESNSKQKPQVIPGDMATPDVGGVPMFSKGTSVTSPPKTVVPESAGGMSGIPRDAMFSDLAFNQGKNIGNWAYQQGVPKWENINGNLVNTNAPGFKGGFQPSMHVSTNGQATLVTPGPGGLPQVSAPVGALDTYKAYQDAEKRAGAQYTIPTPVTLAGEKNPRLMTLVQQVDMLNAPQPATPQAAPVRVPQNGFAGGSKAAAEVGTLEILKPELAKAQNRLLLAKTPEEKTRAQGDIDAITSEIKRAGGPVQLQSKAEEAKQLGDVKNVVEAGDKINAAWLKTSYEPIVANAQTAQSLIDNTQVARDMMRKMGGTGWGTETKAVAANVLSGLGIAPENAKLFAARSQVFQKTAMDRLWTTLNAAKGPQTEGDATRAAKTYASLGNTTEANEFILDMAQAQAERDKARAKFYQNALPIAKEKGDLSEVERIWQQKMPSIFDMPVMKKWGVK